MQKFMKKRKARGFTLVELLIVIIIIGILSGALLLVAGAGTDKANATKIVSNLRSMKTAAVMVYADNNEWPEDVASLEVYLEATLGDGYGLSGDTHAVYSGDLASDTAVTGKLADMASDADVPILNSGGGEYNSGNVYMRIR